MTTFRNPAKWFLEAIGGGRKGKIRITEKSSLTSAPFWYGVNKISGHVGTLPLNIRQAIPGGGSDKATGHSAYGLLRLRPNAYQTPMVFKQAETKRAIMWGNSRSAIIGTGVNRELLPMDPAKTVTGMIEGEKWHCTQPGMDDRILLQEDKLAEMKRRPDKNIMLHDRDVLHIQGFGDGVVGLSLIEYARQSLTISLGGGKRAEDQVTKGFAGKVMLEAPADSQLFKDAKQSEEFLKDFRSLHGADGAADAIGLLRGGVKANVMQMSNKDAEFVALMQYQRQDAALWLLLESILGDDTSVSYNSLEQKNLAYLSSCLSNWIVRWEQEVAVKLLTRSEYMSEGYFAKFNTAALLRTDIKTTMETLSLGITSTIYSPNDARDKLDENPREGGDTYQNPAITPGESGGESTSQSSSDATAKVAVEAYMTHLLKVEQSAVNRMLDEGADLARFDKWYENWCERLGNAIETFGGDRGIAQEHCVSSLKYLERKPETFDLTGTAELLAEKIMKSIGDSDDV